MALNPILVDGYTVTITPNGVWTPGQFSGFTITQTLSPKCKAQSKQIIDGPTIMWVAVGCSNPGPGVLISGGGSMSANSIKVKADGNFCFLKTVTGSCSGTQRLPPPPPGNSVPCSCTMTISDAGQTKVLAE